MNRYTKGQLKFPPYAGAANFRYFSVALLLLLLSACRPFFFLGSLSHDDIGFLREAEESLRQGKYERAIELYQDHIDYRLNLQQRPQWENPYFYYLLIGDIYVKQEKIDEALAAYELAESKEVEKTLVSDRFRYVANWYEDRGERDKALVILNRYRERDPLLFDAMLDRIAKEIVRDEETAGNAKVKSSIN